MRLIILAVVLSLITYAGCTKEDPETASTVTKIEKSATIEVIEQSGRLWGVERVRLNGDGSVTLVDTRHTGNGVNMRMSDASNSVVDSVDLVVGQSCLLSDGRHAFITYELTAIKGDELDFMVTEKFDARAFGDKINVCQKKITIVPYEKQIDLQ